MCADVDAWQCVRKLTTHFSSHLIIQFASVPLYFCLASVSRKESLKKNNNPGKYNVSPGTSVLVARLIALPMEVTRFALFGLHSSLSNKLSTETISSSILQTERNY